MAPYNSSTALINRPLCPGLIASIVEGNFEIR